MCFLSVQRGSCGGWQCDSEGATSAKVTLNFDPSAVPFANGFADGKTETASANFPGTGSIDPIKAIKEPLDFFLANAWSVVFHFENATGIGRRQPDLN